MDTIHIETSQNVEIEHNIASIGERILAHLLDYCFLLAYIFIALLIEGFLKLNGIIAGIIILLPIVFYDLFFEIIYNGQNPGKMIMKIKVIKLDGSQPTLSSYLLRWIFRIIDNLILTGSIATLTIIFNGKGQRLGDLAAGTTIIRLKRKYRLSDTLQTNFSDNYTPTFTEAYLLSETDIRTIKDVVFYIKENAHSGRSATIGNKAKENLEKKLGLQSGLEYRIFLQTVLNDYYFHYQKKPEND